MAELDRFDSQLTAAVQAFADAARTEVDAVAVATRAARGRRAGAGGWLGETVPVPVALLLLLGLILLLAVSLSVGGWLPFRAAVLPVAPAPTAPADIASEAPIPTADALGRVHVTGTETHFLSTPSTSFPDIDATHVSGGVYTITTETNDPRASGTGTFAFSADINGDVGAEWGTYRLETSGGSWEGTCFGSTWQSLEAAIGTCWLTGTGAFAGFTYYRGYSWLPGRVWVEGIIYPGPPPNS